MSDNSLYFFFSSRRRHTRSLRDWSSDVCSSDLGDFDAAVAFFTTAVQENPDRPEYKIALERAQQAASRSHFDKARAYEDKDRKSTRLNSSHVEISYAVFCLKKKKKKKKKKTHQ